MTIYSFDESQAGIKIAGRNISNLRYAEDTTLMTESEKELKSLLMWMKEKSENAGLKLNIQKTKIFGTQSHYFMAKRRGKVGSNDRFYFLGSKITSNDDCSHEIKRCLLLRRKVMTNLNSILKNIDIILLKKV